MTEIKTRRPMIVDIEAAIKAYYKTYIGNKEIMQMFGCSEITAIRLKKKARELEIERGIVTVIPYRIDAEIAFEAWSIDVEKLIRNRQKLIKLGLAEDAGAK